MFSAIEPKILELSMHACAQLFMDNDQYTKTYCDKDVDKRDFNKLAARYIQELYIKWMDRYGMSYEWEMIPPRNMTQLTLFVYDGTITEKQAKEQVFPHMWDNDVSPEWAILDLKILHSKSKHDLNAIIETLVIDNPKQVEQYKSGNIKIIGFFMGRIMKETEGCFEPKAIEAALTQRLTV